MFNYSYILFNADSLAPSRLETMLIDMEFAYLALFLKNKFHDNRSIVELQSIICEELDTTAYGLRKIP